jgi:hypothetical protein
MITEVVKYHIVNYGAHIDPVWWDCRYDDMEVFTMQVKRGKNNSRGCMSREYPFNVWSFVELFSRKQFMREVFRQLLEHWQKHDTWFLNHIESVFKPELTETSKQLELFK